MYLSADELLDLERARLALRAQGIGVDRGRLVREAIALLIMDLETGIDASAVARRLRPVKPGPTDGAPASGAAANGAAASGAAVSGAVTSAVHNGAVASGPWVSGAQAGPWVNAAPAGPQ